MVKGVTFNDTENTGETGAAFAWPGFVGGVRSQDPRACRAGAWPTCSTPRRPSASVGMTLFLVKSAFRFGGGDEMLGPRMG